MIHHRTENRWASSQRDEVVHLNIGLFLCSNSEHDDTAEATTEEAGVEICTERNRSLARGES